MNFLLSKMPNDLERKMERKIVYPRFKSEGERRIAATLNTYGIGYEYERPVIVDDQGITRTLYPDFFLPEFNLHIEYYGRATNQDYDSRSARKQAAYAANNLNVISLYPWDLIHDWPNYLLNQLRTPISETTRIRDTIQSKYATDQTRQRTYHTNTRPYRPTPSRPYR